MSRSPRASGAWWRSSSAPGARWRGGDARKPIIITQLSWPAARGKIPKRRLLGLETTQKGQIARLRAAYKTLASKRRSLHLTQAYWYEWASQYDGNSPQSDVGYRFAGLVKYRRGSFEPDAGARRVPVGRGALRGLPQGLRRAGLRVRSRAGARWRTPVSTPSPSRRPARSWTMAGPAGSAPDDAALGGLYRCRFPLSRKTEYRGWLLRCYRPAM